MSEDQQTTVNDASGAASENRHNQIRQADVSVTLLVTSLFRMGNVPIIHWVEAGDAMNRLASTPKAARLKKTASKQKKH